MEQVRQDAPNNSRSSKKSPKLRLKSGREMLNYMREAKARADQHQKLQETDRNAPVGRSKSKQKIAKSRESNKDRSKSGHLNPPNSQK